MPETQNGTPDFVGCGECLGYVQRRGHVVEPAIAKTAKRHGVHTRRLAHLFVLGIHARHLDGGTL